MINTITIELCAEDRARLDRLAEALEQKASEVFVPSAVEPKVEEEAVTETPEKEDATVKEEATQPEVVKTVSRADLRAKVIELSAKGLKEQTKDIVRAYAQTVTDVPEDKVTECYEKLVALGDKG